MKNKITTLFTLILLLGILSACGSEDVPANKETPTGTQNSASASVNAETQANLETTIVTKKTEPVRTLKIDPSITKPEKALFDIIKHPSAESDYEIKDYPDVNTSFPTYRKDTEKQVAQIGLISKERYEYAVKPLITGSLHNISTNNFEGIAWTVIYTVDRPDGSNFVTDPVYYRVYFLTDNIFFYMETIPYTETDDNVLEEMFGLFEFIIENNPVETTEMQTTASQTTTAEPETTTASDATTAVP